MAGRFRFIAIGIVAFGLLLGVAFGLGVRYGKGKQSTAAGGLTAQQVLSLVGGTGAGAGGGGATGGGAAGGGGAGGAAANGAASLLARATAGKITAVQGQSVTIELRPGVTQKLNLGAATVVNKSSSGNTGDLKEGMSVLVSGQRNADGSFEAQTVNLVPPEIATLLTGGATGGATPGTQPATGAPPPGPTPTR